jgi:tetratricopeptide (TPR) repeat protein
VALAVSATLRGQATPQGDARQHLARGREALKANQLDRAEKEYRDALRLNPASAEAHANLGLIAFARARYAEAAAEFQAALKLRPALRTAQAYLGLSETRLGNVRAARPLLTAAFSQLQDANLKTRVGLELARMHVEAKEFSRGIDVLRVLQDASPKDPEVLYAAYRMHSDLAAQALATMVQSAPQSARVQQVLAQALVSQDDVAGAIAQYRRVLDLDPQLLGIHFEIGRLLLVISQQEPARLQAQKEFEAELALNPTDANSEYELGGIYWLRSDIEQAAGHYTRALGFRPDFVDAHVALGRVRMAQGDLERALSHLLEAVRLDPQSDTARYRLAQAYRKLGRTQEADRESAAFQQLRDSQAPLRALYEQFQQRSATGQKIEASDTAP